MSTSPSSNERGLPLKEIYYHRFPALRKLTSEGIPHALWGWDAFNVIVKSDFRTPAGSAQQILVPEDQLLDAGAALIADTDSQYVHGDIDGTHKHDGSLWLVQRDNADASEKHQHLPRQIRLSPESNYAINTRDRERLVTFAPIPPSGCTEPTPILIPVYIKFIEGIIHNLMSPPAEMNPYEAFELPLLVQMLLHLRVPQYNVTDTHPARSLYPEERQILRELTSPQAHWWLHHLFWERSPVKWEHIEAYKRQAAESQHRAEKNTGKAKKGPKPPPPSGKRSLSTWAVSPRLVPQPTQAYRHHTQQPVIFPCFLEIASSLK
ncbi:hypothetical protein CC1G_09649 [Coprinopsis cinerea okayama7|uniref:Uncharacterized protein n=1 Tax=Coprinopsis cinerea (strain Okayama-7 / 130 / ATCC MYA-4618 / FGSC 9003) TaxID=240176 RepID=A8P9D3_COPC7|nr:hypothetical protein CC1G_09649 [Coprinopsis cinerea okayama7\|eukprot:XP_001839746.2 hypothetical protein CC1G_09649 [Coprinopsis cinerea okayama7\